MKTDSLKEASCPFCSYADMDIIAHNKTAFAIKDNSPVTKDHLLIIPFRHCVDYFTLTSQELCDCHDLIGTLKKMIKKKDPRVMGFNIGTNCGEMAGQTIFHTHIHLIPRRKNDTPNPRGGVRGVIPGKMNY